MNHLVPDCYMEDNSRSFSELVAAQKQKKHAGPDNELVELLWHNGHVVMQSQTHRKPANIVEFRQASKPEPALKSGVVLGNPSGLAQEDETALWFHYPLDDFMEKDFFLEFFGELPMAGVTVSEGKGMDFAAIAEGSVLSAPQESNLFPEKTMPPPKVKAVDSTCQSVILENLSKPQKSNSGSLDGKLEEKGQGSSRIQMETGETSMMTIGSSICGSNQVQVPAEQCRAMSSLSPGKANTSRNEATVASPSGRSGCSFGRTREQSTGPDSNKRKGRDMEDSESQSEGAEFEYAKANKPAHRSTSDRTSRAAKVHNLSERKRRDRINQKMRALQELIPHCNKTDKASMLDEAIEYLKSLQLQLQMMWMGSGMAPMMFPSVHQYMSGMSMPSIPGPVLLPRVPFVNQTMAASASTANQTPLHPDFPNRMPNVNMPESYVHYLGLDRMKVMNIYPYGTQMVQQNQMSMTPGGSRTHAAGVIPAENTQDQSD